MPRLVGEPALNGIEYTHAEIQQKAARARRAVLSQLGFLNWFISIQSYWKYDLDQDDVNFVKSLHLDERPKRGYLFDLKRDFFEITIPHLGANDVPVHYLWTEAEENDGRFLRYSPAYLEESEELRAAQGGGIINMPDLPSYETWLPDLLRYDVFFQDLQIGRVGRILTEFRPEDDYGLVDFYGYGVRPLDSAQERRVYAERFRGLRRRGVTGKMITFHRQNPIGVDEPIAESLASEAEFFFESTYAVRERVKNRYAPRADRVFSPYDGRIIPGGAPMSPTRRSERAEDAGITGRWARSMARPRSLSYSPCRRSSRSRSPVRRGEHQARPSESLSRRSVSEHSERSGAYQSFKGEYAELAPSGRPYKDEWLWDLQFVDVAYLVCKDDRTLLRLKAYAAYGEDTDVGQVLVRAIKFELAVGLYIRVGDARDFSNRNITSLEQSTLGAIYAPGRADTQLVYGLGQEDLYSEYLVKVGMLLARPHARAFIGLGGLLSFIAQVYDEDLVFRYLRGPSMQVTQLDAGDKILHSEDGEEFFLTADRITPSEVSLLIGHVATGNSKTETSLWPPPSIMENESLHTSGAWTPGCYRILTNLRDEIAAGNYKWHTRKMWARYFRAGNMGKYAPEPESVVRKQTFKEGEALMRSCYPINWNKERLMKIRIPEEFDPLASRA
ncbi:hypothetical protein FB451DRAFT_1062444 [Mycena latifolia]|nr:hypothetical protein FB451DRAFT_1062444 [Mycena latifolia]